jgi:hypothetical protein
MEGEGCKEGEREKEGEEEKEGGKKSGGDGKNKIFRTPSCSFASLSDKMVFSLLPLPPVDPRVFFCFDMFLFNHLFLFLSDSY